MQDRFKFRVWDEVHYAEGLAYYAITSDGELVERDFGECDFCTSDERCIIEQCTGLKDKNGKLIYEGDIVETYELCDAALYGVPYMPYGRYLVTWKDTGFLLISEHDEDFIAPPCEVIGNIHEHAHLLEN